MFLLTNICFHTKNVTSSMSLVFEKLTLCVFISRAIFVSFCARAAAVGGLLCAQAGLSKGVCRCV
jgi:hypothetical protein